MNGIFFDAGFLADPTDRYRLIVAIRAEYETFGKRWPKVTFLFCAISRPITEHPKIHAALEEQKEASRELSYPELGLRVLEEEGAPLHWRDAYEAALQLNRKKAILPSPFFNSLIDHRNLFVRVGPGTYGLVQWGLKERKANVDLIAEFLSARSGTASLGEIFHRVGEPAKMRVNSLRMSLDLNPRFYRSVANEYGLRSWLPPREKQTLRMPTWRIEAPDSFARVQRAIERGYDVAAIVARDQPLVS